MAVKYFFSLRWFFFLSRNSLRSMILIHSLKRLILHQFFLKKYIAFGNFGMKSKHWSENIYKIHILMSTSFGFSFNSKQNQLLIIQTLDQIRSNKIRQSMGFIWMKLFRFLFKQNFMSQTYKQKKNVFFFLIEWES